MYLINPRGSNNRLDEQRRERANANRLFDSQNNERGGVNVGSLYYYTGSKIRFEWTAQHSCGHPNNHCEMILQVMCDEMIRDGTTTNTIPINPQKCIDFDCDADVRFGRQESLKSYLYCKYRERNQGLFTASQNLKGPGAIYTRQNPNGARRGYECPEERDYYPYWHPSEWVDVAILTNQESRCKAYRRESQNVKSRWFCDVGDIQGFKKYFDHAPNNQRKVIPINKEDCEQLQYLDPIANMTVNGTWTEAPSHGVPPPDCLGNVISRDNHNGNVEGGQMAGYEFTVPEWMLTKAPEQCALRLRYNISTGDMPHFDTKDDVTTANLTAAANKGRGGNERIPSKYDVGAFYGVPTVPVNASAADQKNWANQRGYEIRNNPQVDPFGIPNKGVKLQLAINTAQYGRTFQDRTHRFAVRKSPYPGAVIHNVNVRGKRGNIVQVYPSVEYDFTPNNVKCKVGDYVHFQWTGSNTNPNNNDGQGKAGTDRSNVVPLRALNYEEPDGPLEGNQAQLGHLGNSYPARVDGQEGTIDFLGLSQEDLKNLARLSPNQLGGELSELDDAGTYFDLGPRQCTLKGLHRYLSTRNNNFSNRSQKGVVEVGELSTSKAPLGTEARTVSLGALSLEASEGALERHIEADLSSKILSESERSAIGITVASELVSVLPVDIPLNSGEALTLQVRFEDKALSSARLMHAPDPKGPWLEVEEYTSDDGIMTAPVKAGGYFIVKRTTSVAAVFLIFFLVVGVLGGGVFFLYKKGYLSKWTRAAQPEAVRI